MAAAPLKTDRTSAARASALPPGIVSFAITLVGLAASIYLTVQHYTASTTLACPENTVINCAKVTSSSYSMVAGVPVALFGAIYFVGMALLCLPPAWRLRRLDALRIVGAAAGVVSSLWFVWGRAIPPGRDLPVVLSRPHLDARSARRDSLEHDGPVRRIAAQVRRYAGARSR
jgi:uncharacterized membrane protein